MLKRKSRKVAPASLLFTKSKNEKGQMQLCVYAQCQYAGTVQGPVWGHQQASVNRVMAQLTFYCQCGRPYHKIRQYEGHRVQTPARHR